MVVAGIVGKMEEEEVMRFVRSILRNPVGYTRRWRRVGRAWSDGLSRL